jgi:hypothetical protein
MPYTIKETKSYPHDRAAVFQAAIGAVGGLQGKVLSEDLDAGVIDAWFDKKIHGKVLGDRTQMKVEVLSVADGESVVNLESYPVDPVGRKLMFGARKGVNRTVVDWFFAHLEHRLK